MNQIQSNANSLPAGRVETSSNTYALSLGSGIEDINSMSETYHLP